MTADVQLIIFYTEFLHTPIIIDVVFYQAITLVIRGIIRYVV